MNIYEASKEWRRRRQKYLGAISSHPVALVRRSAWRKTRLGMRPGVPGEGCREYVVIEEDESEHLIHGALLTMEDLEAKDWEIVDFPLGKHPVYEDPGNLSKREEPKKSPLKMLTEDRSLGFFFHMLAQEVGRVDGDFSRGRQELDEKFVQWFLEHSNLSRVAQAASGVALTDEGESETSSFALNKKVFFAGAGELSRRDARLLVDRLEYALLLRSGTQQQGLMGTDYDHEEVEADEHEIRLALEDIAYALFGEKARDFMIFTEKI